MIRFFKFPFLLALAYAGQFANAQTPPPPVGVPPRPLLPLSTSVTNGNITFSWPLTPGKWELLGQPVAGANEWKTIPGTQYQTNGTTILAVLPLPKETSFYCVRRAFNMHPPPLPKFRHVPPRPTNAPPRFKRSSP